MVTGESTKETVKTIARGMPGDSGVTVVTMLVCFVLFCTRGCGCIGHPAFPAPSVFFGRTVFAKLGRIAPRECGGVFEIVWLFENRICARANARYLSPCGRGRIAS